jgi:hypothetical protein
MAPNYFEQMLNFLLARVCYGLLSSFVLGKDCSFAAKSY